MLDSLLEKVRAHLGASKRFNQLPEGSEWSATADDDAATADDDAQKGCCQTLRHLDFSNLGCFALFLGDWPLAYLGPSPLPLRQRMRRSPPRSSMPGGMAAEGMAVWAWERSNSCVPIPSIIRRFSAN